MKKLTALCLVLSLAGFLANSCFSQNEAFHIELLRAKTGAVLAFSGMKHSFTVSIVSDSISATDAPNYLTVHNQILQVSCVAIPNGSDLSGYNRDQQKTTLDSYADYELEYFQKDLKITIKNLKKEWVVIQNRLYLMWQYDVPIQKLEKLKGQELQEQITGQIFLSAILHDQILDINTPLFSKNNKEKARKLLEDLASSLQTYDKQLDIPALAKTLE
ncbi:MAG TPA: hypothetical protein VNW04_11740 [Puia sp.]|jgi:hypothetical protein|nr:hypothetical protein [Puia sp.]